MVHIPFDGLNIPYYKQVEEHTLHDDGREYVVCLHDGVDYDQFWTEVESLTNGLANVPDRQVRVFNELPVFEKICHYVLTDDEVKILINDPRVRSISPPFETIPGLIRSVTTTSQVGNFNKPIGTSNGNYINWGLLRSNYATNPYELTTNKLTVPSQYDYNLDGSNVDVVIMDTGIEPNHPEFTNANGVSRLKKITWFKEAGISEFVDLHSAVNWASIDPVAYPGPVVWSDSAVYFISSGQSYDLFTYINYQAPGNIKWPDSLRLGIPIKSSNSNLNLYKIGSAVLINVSKGAKDNNHSYILRCQWQTEWGRSNNKGVEVDWQIKFCDSNHMEITIIRHDYVTSAFKDFQYGVAGGGNPEFGMTTFSGNTVDFTSAFRNKQQLVSSSSQPISIVLGTADNGNTWTVYQNSKMVFSNNAWQIQTGVATVVDPATLTTQAGVGSLEFSTPFSFKIGTAMRKELYSDYHGHGTHCTGITAGKTFGWAKNANIYMMKLNDLTSSNNPDWKCGFNEYMCWGLIKKFHENKPINPVTGFKNPTIVNMSFGTSYAYLDAFWLDSGIYRGQTWTPGISPQSDFSSRGIPSWKFSPAGTYNIGGQNTLFSKGFWFSVSCDFDSSDVGLSELIAAGVICCIAAGNNGMRADNSSGDDYDNSFNLKDSYSNRLYNFHYNRGGSPKHPNAIMVGAIDLVYPNGVIDQQHTRASNNLGNRDQVAYFSNTGSLIDIYSPGVNIMSATSSVNAMSGVSYNASSTFKQVSISGTSMATPQVAGLLALYMQQNSSKTPAQAKQWLIDNSKATLYSTNIDNDYNTYYSLKGGPNRQMFNPLITASVITIPPVVTDIGTSTNPIIIYKNSTNNLMTFGISGATSLSINVVASHGTTNINGLVLTYTPTTNYSGTDTFKFVARNSVHFSNVGTAYINVIDSVGKPVASNINITVVAKTTLNLINPIVNINYDSVTVVSNPLYGTVNISQKQLLYTPRSTTLELSDSFSYTVTNSAGVSNIAQVFITITQPVYPAPVAKTVNVTTTMNTTIVITTDTDNATDIQIYGYQRSNSTIVSIPIPPSSNNYRDIKTGITFSYTPPAGFSGTDFIYYTAYQARGNNTNSTSSYATINITIIDAKPATGMSISNGVVMTNGINLRLI